MAHSTFVEYTVLIEDTAKLSDRRQTVNNLLIGLNGLLLAGLFFPLLNYQLDNYFPVIIVAAVTIAAVVVNRSWFQLNDRYRRLVNVRIEYLTKLEARIRQEENAPEFGIYHEESAKLYNTGNTQSGFSKIEREFILVLTLIYPLVTLGAAAAVSAAVFLGLHLPTIVP